MKNIVNFQSALFLTFTLMLPLISYGQEETGLPGDHFSLYGALEMFKESKDLESFEKSINEEDNYVNNLDLNEDGDIDYIRIEDHMDEGVHAIILQAVVGKEDIQDIAVIEIEQTGEEEALLQIIGDEDIYGENIIVEPFEEEGVDNGSKGPNFEEETVRIVVNVYFWPSVRYIYRPVYRPWVSPWYWGYYPRWWRPWRPHPFSWHYNRRVHYHVGFHAVHIHRVPRAHRVYTPQRRASAAVRTAHATKVNQYRADRGVKKTGVITQSTKTKVVSGPNGGKAAVSRKTTTVAGKNNKGGKAAGRKSSTTVVGKKGDKTVAGRKTKSVGAKKKANGTTVAGKKTTQTRAAKSGNRKMATKKTKSTKVKRKKN